MGQNCTTTCSPCQLPMVCQQGGVAWLLIAGCAEVWNVTLIAGCAGIWNFVETHHAPITNGADWVHRSAVPNDWAAYVGRNADGWLLLATAAHAYWCQSQGFLRHAHSCCAAAVPLVCEEEV